VPAVGLQSSCVVASIGESEAAGVAAAMGGRTRAGGETRTSGRRSSMASLCSEHVADARGLIRRSTRSHESTLGKLGGYPRSESRGRCALSSFAAATSSGSRSA
jgi:hypothetical protein